MTGEMKLENIRSLITIERISLLKQSWNVSFGSRFDVKLRSCSSAIFKFKTKYKIYTTQVESNSFPMQSNS